MTEIIPEEMERKELLKSLEWLNRSSHRLPTQALRQISAIIEANTPKGDAAHAE